MPSIQELQAAVPRHLRPLVQEILLGQDPTRILERARNVASGDALAAFEAFVQGYIREQSGQTTEGGTDTPSSFLGSRPPSTLNEDPFGAQTPPSVPTQTGQPASGDGTPGVPTFVGPAGRLEFYRQALEDGENSLANFLSANPTFEYIEDWQYIEDIDPELQSLHQQYDQIQRGITASQQGLDLLRQSHPEVFQEAGLTGSEQELAASQSDLSRARAEESRASAEAIRQQTANAEREYQLALREADRLELDADRDFYLSNMQLAIQRGQLDLAAEQAQRLHERELRDQSLDFISKIAENPDALASLVSTEAGKQMLNQIGFNALTVGATPERLQKFFTGPATAGMANQMLQETVYYTPEINEEQRLMAAREAALTAAGELSPTDFASLDPNSPDSFQRAQLETATAAYNQAYAGYEQPRESRVEQVFQQGNLRDPGQLRPPSAQDLRGLSEAGDLDSLLFEAALGGYGSQELFALSERHRPGERRILPTRRHLGRR